MNGNIHINRARFDFVKRIIRKCPTEGKRRRMFGWFQAWYGWNFTCLGCGDSWEDGERGERPFRPGWRKESIAHGKKLWATAQPRFKSVKEMLANT